MENKKKGAIDTDMLTKIIMALILLGVSLGAVVLLQGKGGTILDTIKSFFQFGF